MDCWRKLFWIACEDEFLCLEYRYPANLQRVKEIYGCYIRMCLTASSAWVASSIMTISNS